MSDAQIEAMVRYLKALADESRLRILGLLAAGEQSVEQLAAQLGLRGPTVSHHLAKLREAGLVRMRADGSTHYYSFEAARLHALGEELFSPGALASAAAPTVDRWDQAVLDNFRDGDRIEIPASRKKRAVILRWLAERFERGERYPERRVNEILGRHHPDFATLRRELVGAGLLARQDGVYWRVDEAGAAAEAGPRYEGATGEVP